MTLEVVRDVIAWSAVLNFALLAVWFLVFSLAHGWMYRIHGKWFTLSVESFDAIHYGGMAFFKLCIIIFNVVPYLALRIVI